MLRYFDSFDHYDTANASRKGWTIYPGTDVTIAAVGRNGTNGLRCAHDWTEFTYAVHGIEASGPTAIVGVGFREYQPVDDGTTAYTVLHLLNGSTPLITLRLTASRAFEVCRGHATSNAVIGATVGGVVSTMTYHFIELKVLLHDSTGTAELRVDGVTRLALTGVDTISAGAAVWTGIGLGSQYVNSTSNYVTHYDDLYVCDGSGGANDDFLGDHRIICRVAEAGNGTYTGWSPSSGTNHGTLVGENPPDTSTYCQSSTVGARDTYNFAALGVVGTIKCVQACNLLRADAAGVRHVAPSTRALGGATFDAEGTILGSDWGYQLEQMTSNPVTVADWTVAEVDSTEFGVVVIA